MPALHLQNTSHVKYLPAIQFKSKPASWWRGRTVRLSRLVTLRSGAIRYRGTKFLVYRKYGGLDLVHEMDGPLQIRRCTLHACEVQAIP